MAHPTLVLTLAVLTVTFVSIHGTAPASACSSTQCPQYTSEDRTGFEIRTMTQDTKWVVTSLIKNGNSTGWSDTRTMFRKLFNYIRGANVGGVEIDMTAPVLTKIHKLRADSDEHRMTMMFYLPGNSPAPTNPTVSIITVPAGQQFFARRFIKYVWVPESSYVNNLQAMKSAIGTQYTYDNNAYFRAGYEAPWTFKKTLEVWMEKNP